jgi:hypothetical protein
VEMAHNSGQLSDVEYIVICKWYDWIQRNIDMHLDLIGKRESGSFQNSEFCESELYTMKT